MQRVTASLYGLRQGFSLVELVVVMVVIMILVAVVSDTSSGYQMRARDSERAVDTEVIAKSLERHYRTQAVSIGASYPSTVSNAATIATIVDNTDATIAPLESSNSIVIAVNNAAQTPTIAQYVYQPLNLDGSLCTSTPCVRFKLYYRLEKTSDVVVVNSVRQQ